LGKYVRKPYGRKTFAAHCRGDEIRPEKNTVKSVTRETKTALRGRSGRDSMQEKINGHPDPHHADKTTGAAD